jgi:hypothetical protein
VKQHLAALRMLRLLRVVVGGSSARRGVGALQGTVGTTPLPIT